MTTLTISLAVGQPNTRQTVVLDGLEYVLDLRWSGREERWFLDLYDAAGTLLAGSIKVINGLPLLYKLRGGAPGLPPGELVVLDGRDIPADPGLEDLGDAAQLAYVEAA